MIRIYFNDKPLFITSERTPEIEEYLHHEDTVLIDEFNSHTVKAMIHEMMTEKIHAGVFLHPDTAAILQAFKRKLSFVQAAGGFVYTPDHHVLMIFRRGKWDLPKGKLDPGEDLETCALREITEETGVSEIESKGTLCITYHTYHQDGKHWLKETHWFLVKSQNKTPFQPQTEEDIEKCEWVSVNEMGPYSENTHASIRDVLNAGVQKLGEPESI